MPSTPNILWNPPALLLVGMLVDSALNAVAQDGAGNAVAGTFAYDQVAGTVVGGPAPAAPTVLPLVINATFTPSDLTAWSVATAQVTIDVQLAYTIPAEARQLAKAIPTTLRGSLLNLSDDDLAAMLALASDDIDAAGRYQGRKYDPTQIREFPRIDASPSARQFPPAPPSINDPSFYVFGGSPTFIFDWDPNAGGGAGAAVVPQRVKMAAIHQVLWLMQPKFAKRLEAIRSGLTGVRTGSAEESYRASAANAGEIGHDGLGNRAANMLKKYRLMTGRML